MEKQTKLHLIKFSHNYLKFPFGLTDGSLVRLLDCLIVDHKDLSEEFITYDTSYMVDGELNQYTLPKTKLMLL